MRYLFNKVAEEWRGVVEKVDADDRWQEGGLFVEGAETKRSVSFSVELIILLPIVTFEYHRQLFS